MAEILVSKTTYDVAVTNTPITVTSSQTLTPITVSNPGPTTVTVTTNPGEIIVRTNTGVQKLDDLTDVDTTTGGPTQGNALIYGEIEGTPQWVPGYPGFASTSANWNAPVTLTLTGAVTGTVNIQGPTTDNSVDLSTTLANVTLGTQTTGDYIASLVQGTGVTITNNSGEGATPTIAIGQAVGTTSNVTFNDLIVDGNLTVNGTTTSIDTTNLVIEDNTILLNKNEVGAGVTAGSAGIEIERGSLSNAKLYWDESDDTWKFTVPGFVDIGINKRIAITPQDNNENFRMVFSNAPDYTTTGSALYAHETQSPPFTYNPATSTLNVVNVNGNAATATTASTATVANTVALTATNTTNATHYVTFVDSATGNEDVKTDTSLTYNPNTNTLTAGTFVGSLTGSASKVALTATNTTDATHYVTFVDSATGNEDVRTDTSLTYNPNSNTLTATTFSGNASTASVAGKVTLTATNTTNAEHYLTFVDTATGDEDVRTDSSLTYNPSTNTLTASVFYGSLTGNANTAGTATNSTYSTLVDSSTRSGEHYINFTSASTGNESIRTDSSLTYFPAANSINLGSRSSGQLVTGLIETSYVDLYEPYAPIVHKIRLSAPDELVANLTLKLPATAGTAGQAMTTDGAGNLSFTTIVSGGNIDGGNAYSTVEAATIIFDGGGA